MNETCSTLWGNTKYMQNVGGKYEKEGTAWKTQTQMRDNIKLECTEIGCEDVYRFEVTQDSSQCDECNESPGCITVNDLFTRKVIV